MCIIRLGGFNNSHHNKTVEKVPLGISNRLKECQHSLSFADYEVVILSLSKRSLELRNVWLLCRIRARLFDMIESIWECLEHNHSTRITVQHSPLSGDMQTVSLFCLTVSLYAYNENPCFRFSMWQATTWLCEMVVVRRNTIPSQENGLIASVLPAYFENVYAIHFLSATHSYTQRCWGQSFHMTKSRGMVDGHATASSTLSRNRQPFPVECWK